MHPSSISGIKKLWLLTLGDFMIEHCLVLKASLMKKKYMRLINQVQIICFDDNVRL